MNYKPHHQNILFATSGKGNLSYAVEGCGYQGKVWGCHGEGWGMKGKVRAMKQDVWDMRANEYHQGNIGLLRIYKI